MNQIKFRQLWICQNGHTRWVYYSIETTLDRKGDTELKMEWGDRRCDCPTHELGEGFSPYKDPQIYTGIRDKQGDMVYVGDYLKHDEKIYQVLYNPGGFFELQDVTSGNFMMTWAPSSFIPLGVLVGNTEDTPELKNYGRRNVN